MTHSLDRFRMTAPLRVVLVVLCAGAMLLGSTLALANAVSSARASPSVSLERSVDHATAMTAVHERGDHASSEPCDRVCEPTSSCSSDCLASCVAGGSLTACAPASGLSSVHPSARAPLARAPDRPTPAGPSAPPLLPPPIV